MLLLVLVQNKAICVREDKNIKGIYELSKGFYTNVDIRYDIILQSKVVFDAIVESVREFIEPSVEKIVSTQCLNTNNVLENKFLNALFMALGLSQTNWQYDMKQIVIIGTSSKHLLDQVMRNITYLGSVIILLGPDDSDMKNDYKDLHKIKILLTPKDLLLLSDTERWYLVNDR